MASYDGDMVSVGFQATSFLRVAGLEWGLK